MKRSVAAAASLLLLLATLLTSSPASAQSDNSLKARPVILSDTDYDWLAGTDAWVNINWSTEETITDVSLVATSNDANVTIEYPENTQSFTGLANGSELSPYEIDRTAIFLQTTDDAKGKFKITLEMTYTADGQTKTEKVKLSFKSREWDGEFYEFVTDEVVVPAGADAAAGWVDLEFIGLAPDLGEFQVDVTDGAAEIEVFHPQGTFTSLHHDDRLKKGEKDVVRVWIDPDTLESGQEIELSITTKFGSNKGAKSETHKVKLKVG